MAFVPLLVIILAAVLLVMLQQFYLIEKITALQNTVMQHQRRVKDYHLATCRICEEYGANLVPATK